MTKEEAFAVFREVDTRNNVEDAGVVAVEAVLQMVDEFFPGETPDETRELMTALAVTSSTVATMLAFFPPAVEEAWLNHLQFHLAASRQAKMENDAEERAKRERLS